MPYRKNRRTGGTFWIVEAVKKSGALRRYIRDTYGPAGFNKDGTIKMKLIEDLASGTCPICLESKCVCPTEQTRRRARLARTLRSLNK